MKTAFITGGNRGIGFETAKQLGLKGFTVIIGSRNKQRGEEAVVQLQTENIDAHFVVLDVTQPQTIESAVQFIETSFGKLDVLVNNAGIMHPEESWIGNTALTISESALTKTFITNFFGPIRVTQACIPLLELGEDARIINVSAKLASLTYQSDRKSQVYNSKPFAYNASKTALNQWTVHLAHALRRQKIKVVSIYPGWVKTRMGGDNASLEPIEGVQTILRAVFEDVESGSFIHEDHQLPW
jgi:NAD(P)-dependent dehydrogenase (short-subunit alcohol dehydrogenase family)